MTTFLTWTNFTTESLMPSLIWTGPVVLETWNINIFKSHLGIYIQIDPK